MNKILAVLFWFLIGTQLTISAQQIIESADIPKLKNIDLFPLGESNGNVFFYGTSLHKNDTYLNVFKFKASNLELLETKKVYINSFEKQVYKDAYCKVEGIYKNNKFYFFYSLLEGQTFHVYLKSVKEDLSDEKNIELGVIAETGYQLLGEVLISYSPDYKRALVSLKNRCEKKKAVGLNTEIFENTELIHYDLINDKILFTKKTPIEMDGLRLKTANYKIDNDGNISFIASIAEKNGGNTIKAIGTGSLEKTQEKINISEIDVSKATSISSNLWQLKNGDVICSAVLNNNIKIRYIATGNKIGFEKEIQFPNFKDSKNGFYTTNLSESSAGYYITLREVTYSGNTRIYSVIYIDKKGNLVWNKTLPLIPPIFFYDSYYGTGITSKVDNNKLHVFYLENKPYEIDDKKQRMIDEKVSSGNFDLKNFNTVEVIINEDGKIEKNIIHDNMTYELNPLEKYTLNADGATYFVMPYKKAFKIKKVTLK